MPAVFETFLLAFLPLFVALDPIGLAALFLGLTRDMSPAKYKRTALHASLTAGIIAVLFLFLGKITFEALGITVSDFKIAGGLILLILAIRDLISTHGADGETTEDIAVVPLGMPLIAGPATITTLLILVDSLGLRMTLISLGVNLLLVYCAFRYAWVIQKLIGIRGLRAFSKIIAMLLAAIAVNMIRRGFEGR